ncbi:MAG: hypothetical protein QS748_10520 [Candidatus Endonucleobacter bathymodioli]|uniref:Uncharacterized protein n=1 Tax=Candidatus Endonucleibacter bathymodioli TaxID=539814 RepID=A0AA90SDQ3_9GAMM|nr:hypothetical protein [Candidatus Endonucleobacter bathymodioli]
MVMVRLFVFIGIAVINFAYGSVILDQPILTLLCTQSKVGSDPNLYSTDFDNDKCISTPDGNLCLLNEKDASFEGVDIVVGFTNFSLAFSKDSHENIGISCVGQSFPNDDHLAAPQISQKDIERFEAPTPVLSGEYFSDAMYNYLTYAQPSIMGLSFPHKNQILEKLKSCCRGFSVKSLNKDSRNIISGRGRKENIILFRYEALSGKVRQVALVHCPEAVEVGCMGNWKDHVKPCLGVVDGLISMMKITVDIHDLQKHKLRFDCHDVTDAGKYRLVELESFFKPTDLLFDGNLKCCLLVSEDHDWGGEPPYNKDNSNNIVSATQSKKVNAIFQKPVQGYFLGQIPVKMIEGEIYLHKKRKLDRRGSVARERLFETLIPYLMEKENSSQTRVLTDLIEACQFIPYVRKIKRNIMDAILDDPLQLQEAMVLELIQRMQQNYKLDELLELVKATLKEDAFFIMYIDGHVSGKEKAAGKEEGTNSIGIGLQLFTKEQLGDEAFRQISSGMESCKEDQGKTKFTCLEALLARIAKQQQKAMTHWKDIYLQIIYFQNSINKEVIAKALGRGERFAREDLIPATHNECLNVAGVISKCQETWSVHPGFKIMMPLIYWFSESWMKGDYYGSEQTSKNKAFIGGKLNSRMLSRIESMAKSKLYTKLSGGGDCDLSIDQEELIECDSESPFIQDVLPVIKNTNVNDLALVVDLFSKVLCDLTPEVTVKHRLAIVYTLNKCIDANLVKKLLGISDCSHPPLQSLYMYFLILTHHDEFSASGVNSYPSVVEQSANCYLKTLLLRAALCTRLISENSSAYVGAEVLARANLLIDHHNEVIGRAVHELVTPYESAGNEWGGNDFFYVAPGDKYLAIPTDIVINGDKNTVTCNIHDLLLPKDKHFRLNNDYNKNRRGSYVTRDNKKILYDFFLVPQKMDVSFCVDLSKEDIPVSVFFSGDDDLCVRHPLMAHSLNQACNKIILGGNKGGKATLQLVKSLFSLARKESSGQTCCVYSTVKKQMSENCNIMQDKVTVPPEGNKGIKCFLQELQNHLDIVKTNRDRKQILEYCAFLLFYQINIEEVNGEIDFKSLVKFLYTIQSRTADTMIGDKRCLKADIAKYYLQKPWGEPGDNNGKRIKYALMKACKDTKDGDYKEIMACLLKEVKPNTNELALEVYTSKMYEVISEINKIFSTRNEMNDLNSMIKLEDPHSTPVTQEYLSNRLKYLLRKAVECCDKLLGTRTGSEGSGIGMYSSEGRVNSSISRFNLSTHGYLCDSLKIIVSNIMLHVDGIRENGTMPPDCRPNINKYMDSLSLALAHGKSSITGMMDINESVEMAENIAKLHKVFVKLQLSHISHDIHLRTIEAHERWKELDRDLRKLRAYTIVDADVLRRRIAYLTHGTRIPMVVMQDKVSKLEINKIEEMLCRGLRITQLVKTLEHQEIKSFSDNPGELEDRLNKAVISYPGKSEELSEKLKELQRILSAFNNDVLVSNVSLAEHMHFEAIKDFRNEDINILVKKEYKCENHELFDLTDMKQKYSKISILRNMKTSHENYASGFEDRVLSIKQKKQLLAIIQAPIIEEQTSKKISLFDMMGMEQLVKPSYKNDEFQITNMDKVLSACKNTHKLYLETVDEKRRLLAIEKKTVNETQRKYSAEVAELPSMNLEMERLLGDKKNEKVSLFGVEYSYMDVLISYFVAGAVSYGNADASSKQCEVMRIIECCKPSGGRFLRNLIQEKECSDLLIKCKNMEVDFTILPDIAKLSQFERYTDDDAHDVQRDIEYVTQLIATQNRARTDNLSEINKHVKNLQCTLEPLLKEQREKTEDAESRLFEQAFEQGRYLSQVRMIQSMLCGYIQKGLSIDEIKNKVIGVSEDLKKLIPDMQSDIINSPSSIDCAVSASQMSLGFFVFSIINVKGAYPLLKSLHETGMLNVKDFIICDETDKRSSALVFAAATGRHMAYQAIIDILSDLDISVTILYELLTSSLASDNSNLLHHLANLAQPSSLEELLKIINSVSNKQIYDADYCDQQDYLPNNVARNSNFLLQKLLVQFDVNNRLPGDILCFRIGETIKDWSKDTTSLSSYCNEFMINDLKHMWGIMSITLDNTQLLNSVEWFMKGVGDFDDLTEDKRIIASKFIKDYLRNI